MFLFFVSVGFTQKKPNIILILSDDAGYADFSFQSSRFISTPNIDRIANEGVKFTNGYVTGSVCSPSRAGLLTGITQAEFGHTTNFIQGVKYNLPLDSLGLPVDQRLVGEYLKPLGYTTGLVGKWHLGFSKPFHPNSRGFDYFWGFLWGSSHYFVEKKRTIEENARDLDETSIPYTTDAIGDQSVHFIKSNKSKPFFLFVSFNAPHTPMQAKPELLKRFTEELKDEKRALNAALTWNMDENVGKIYRALEEAAILDNTIIIFTNDNGGQEQYSFADNYPLRGMKGDVYEGGIRVPMAMRWTNKIKPGSVCETPVTSLDFLPTFINAAGADLKDKKYSKLEGASLIDIINDSRDEYKNRLLHWYVDTDKGCIRKGDYKMVFNPGKPAELYDLKNDIGETINLATSEIKIAQELSSSFLAWKKTLPAFRWYPVRNNAQSND